jgi:3-hydroxybutyryl-CoA dehydratase
VSFYVGETASFSKTITESDVYLFAGICGDFNSIHVNKVKAELSRFEKQVVHGALVNSFISTVLGMKLPGEGTIYMSQNSKFLKPVYFNDTITAKIEIVEINGSKALLKTQVYNQNDELVIDGEAKVLLPQNKK